MKIVFSGVGEALDTQLTNSSILAITKELNILLDCGYSVPQQLWRYNSGKNFLDVIYISHFHADHCFGLPPLLLRMWEEKRKQKLTVICQKGLEKKIKKLLNDGYQGLTSRLNFVKFVEVSPGKKLILKKIKFSFALTDHISSNLAIRIDKGKESFCYSGDGMFNKETVRLYKNSNLLIHDGYFFDKKIGYHANIIDLIEMSKKNRIKTLALIHINRNKRKENKKRIMKLKDLSSLKVIVPEQLGTYSL